MAHGTARHGTERLTKARGLRLGAILLLDRDPPAGPRSSCWTAILLLDRDPPAGPRSSCWTAILLLDRDPSTLEEIGAQLARAGTMATFSRSDEREADKLGVV